MTFVPPMPVDVGMVRTSLPLSHTLSCFGGVVGDRDVRVADGEVHLLIGLDVETTTQSLHTDASSVTTKVGCNATSIVSQENSRSKAGAPRAVEFESADRESS
jgi:hypothetical protein